MNDGYVKLFRKSIDSRVFHNPGLWQLWTWCLMKASHKEIWVPVSTGRGDTEVKLLPGQFVFGRHAAAKELKQKSFSTYKRMLKLQSMQNLNIQSNTHFSLVTICNWEKYQTQENQEEQAKEQPRNNQGTTKEQPRNTNKNAKNVKNIRKGNGQAVSLPNWIKEETWKSYIEMRSRIKKPATENAKSLIIKKLEQLKTEGQDPNHVLEQSIMNSWQGIFPLKEDFHVNSSNDNRSAKEKWGL